MHVYHMRYDYAMAHPHGYMHPSWGMGTDYPLHTTHIGHSSFVQSFIDAMLALESWGKHALCAVMDDGHAL